MLVEAGVFHMLWNPLHPGEQAGQVANDERIPYVVECAAGKSRRGEELYATAAVKEPWDRWWKETPPHDGGKNCCWVEVFPDNGGKSRRRRAADPPRSHGSRGDRCSYISVARVLSGL